MARTSWFTSTPTGRNSGSMVLNMNRMVISGTERNSSMKPVQIIRISGMVERRPSASIDAGGEREGDTDAGDHQGQEQPAPLPVLETKDNSHCDTSTTAMTKTPMSESRRT